MTLGATLNPVTEFRTVLTVTRTWCRAILQIDSCLVGQEIKEHPAHFRLWRIQSPSRSPQFQTLYNISSNIHFNIMLKNIISLGKQFGVFSTVHHSIELFHHPTLMHNFLYSLTICLLHY